MKKNITKSLIIMILTLALCLSLAPATALAAAPPAPKGLKAATISATSVKLTWKKTSKAKGYTVYKKSGNKYVKVAATTKNYYTVKNLKPETKYSFRVAVKTAKGASKQCAAVTVRTKSAAAQPNPTPTPTPARTPGKVDQNLLGLWTFTYAGSSMGASSMFDFNSDGTFSMTLVTISYGTSRYTIDRSGYYSAENGVIKCSNITVTETRAESSGGIWFEKSRIQGKTDDFQFEYITGTDEYGRYLLENYNADGTRDPIENETVKYRLHTS